MSPALTLPEDTATWELRPLGREPLSDDAYWAFCAANRDLRIERSGSGVIAILPLDGGETACRVADVTTDVAAWSHSDGRGKAFGPSVQFFLPDGSGLSPDAAWVSNESLAKLTKQQRRKFLRLSPEFIVEVLSPTDSLKQAKAKMQSWIANGVQLAWLIDGDARTVYVYRPGRAPRTRRGLREIAGEGPVAGFTLHLLPIWRGL